MKRHIAFMAFFVSVACLAAPTANEDFVLAEDAQTFTNAVNAAKEYADGKIAEVVSNKADAVRVVSGGGVAPGEIISCEWHDGNVLLKWYENEGIWHSLSARPRLGGQKSLAYNSGQWRYMSGAVSDEYAFTNAVPVYGFPPTLTLFQLNDVDASITLTRTNEVYSTASNVYPVVYMDDLSRAADDATNYTDWVVQNLDIPDPDLTEYAKKTEVQGVAVQAATNAVAPVVAIVDSWEGYWSGSNVVFEVTNYYGNTTGAKPRLRIREYRDEQWRTVWDEENKFAAAESNIVNRVAETNAALRVSLKEEFAPLAWGTVTDKGSPNPVTNTTFMTSPETYFAGGTEYQRVAVGSGTICVLVDKGALARTAGQPGTFRFQDDGGTNYFGFVKTDSYTIGCRTDGITVADGLVTLRYDVIMGGTDVPVVYWRENLREGSWVQLNNVDGTAADGAPYTVTWYTSGGSYYAAINCTGNASGFFRAETAVMGDVVWETNMRARLGGGMECTNTATHVNGVIRPSYNGSSVTWTWSLR